MNICGKSWQKGLLRFTPELPMPLGKQEEVLEKQESLRRQVDFFLITFFWVLFWGHGAEVRADMEGVEGEWDWAA